MGSICKIDFHFSFVFSNMVWLHSEPMSNLLHLGRSNPIFTRLIIEDLIFERELANQSFAHIMSNTLPDFTE